MQKSRAEPVSRSQMLAWINRTLNINETRIENLGSGVVYCLLLNHHFPATIALPKITMIPRSPNDHRNNLRRLQEGLATLDVRSISFDVFKVAEMTYAENWALVCKLHKLFQGVEKEKPPQEPKEAKDHWWPAKPELPKESKEQWWPAKAPELRPDPASSFSLASSVLNPLSTPVKGSCQFLQQGKSRWQSMSLIEQIKRIVGVQGHSDREKVRQLRQLLGLQEEEGQEEAELRDLLSDYKKKQEVILID